MDTDSGGTGMAPTPAPQGRVSSRASSALAALSILVILLYLLWRFVWQYRKHGTSSNSSTGATAPQPIASSARPPPPSCPPRDATAAYGPPRTTTTTTTTKSPLSVLVVPVAVARFGTDKVDCAVCLAELGDGEAAAARLVPGCGHGFHAACIEAWFRVNSTCPLCRAAVGQGAGEAPVPQYDSNV